MTIHRHAPAALAAVAFLVLSTTAFAQTRPPSHEWSHGTMLGLFAGAGVDGSRASPLAGAGIGWEVLPWFGLEGSGTWLDRGAHAEAFAADFKALVGLPRAGALAPFAAGGVGVYRTTSDGARAVTDPSIVAGGGINLFVTTHAALRPEVAATVVMGDSRTYVITTVALRVTYHFEDHPITPAR